VLRAPELDAVLQVGSHENGVKGQNHLLRPADHASLNAAQDLKHIKPKIKNKTSCFLNNC